MICALDRIFTDISSQSLLNRPPSIDSVLDIVGFNSQRISPIINRFSFSFKFKKSCTSLIAILSRNCRPSTIFFGITTIIINPVYRQVFSIGGKHVVSKIHKFFPTLTNFYSSTAIIGIRFVFKVRASIFHVMPNSIKTSISKSVFHNLIIS